MVICKRANLALDQCYAIIFVEITIWICIKLF